MFSLADMPEVCLYFVYFLKKVNLKKKVKIYEMPFFGINSNNHYTILTYQGRMLSFSY